MGRFDHLRLPGGEAAIKEPWRIARSMLADLGKDDPGTRPWPWLKEYASQDRFIGQMLDKNINTPVSSSCGRLFDGVAALLGLRLTIAYEGQAAIVLESVQDMSVTTGYTCPVREKDGMLILGTRELFARVVRDWEKGTDPADARAGCMGGPGSRAIRREGDRIERRGHAESDIEHGTASPAGTTGTDRADPRPPAPQ
jgi:hydrogenase maturation protein HypF